MKKLRIICTVMMLVVFAFNTVISQNNFQNHHILDPYNPEYVEGELLVKFRNEVKIDIQQRDNQISTGLISIDDFLVKYEGFALTKVFKSRDKKEIRYVNTHKGERIEVPQLFNIYKLKFNSKQDAKELAELLSEDPLVEFAEPDYYVYTTETYPDDPLYQDDSQWYVDAVDAPLAWDLTTGDTNQIIGILDTGIDFDHPDLDDNIWTNWDEIPDNAIDDDGNGFVDDRHGWDFVNNDNDPNDNNSHGTHISGIAAGEGNNSTGITGMVWAARIMPVKILNSTGYGSSSNFAQAIEYASDNGAVIINMSLGNYAESSIVETALLNAYSEAILVAAAGNDTKKLVQEGVPSGNFFPACYDFVLGVMAAANDNCDLAAFSNIDPSGPIEFWNNWGYNYELTAPGVNIMSTIPGGSYNSLNGTSMASAIVSGICALYKSHNDTASNEVLWANLIQGSQNGCVNAYNTLTFDLISYGADLRYIDYTLTDTLNDCDADGRPDAGETVELHVTVKNVGNYAENVWSKVRLVNLDDSTKIEIIDSTSFVGDISTFYTMKGELDPMRIKIDSNLTNGTVIPLEFMIWVEGSVDTTFETISLTIEHGVEINGSYDYLRLTGDAYYLVSDVVVIDSLVIDPGVTLTFSPIMFMAVTSYLYAVGTPDSMITFTGVTEEYYWNGIVMNENTNSLFEYCKFKFGRSNYKLIQNPGIIKHCIFDYCNAGITNINNAEDVFKYNVITNHSGYGIDGAVFVAGNTLSDVSYNVIAENVCTANHTSCLMGSHMRCPSDTLEAVHDNVFINNFPYSLWLGTDALAFKYLPCNYFGTTDVDYIHTTILDFYELGTWPALHIVILNGILTSPPPECHGVVWKVTINDLELQTEPLNTFGAETLKFDVYFNRAMDTSILPLLSFGLLDPYLQTIVDDSAGWSADSTIWTAYHTIGIEAGDGIQTIRVEGAQDTDHFEIPIERSRFQFVIQAAGAASINFNATPGIGKVDLEWPPVNTPDLLGYNLYRYFNLTDSTYSSTIKLNDELIIDTIYTDFTVIPDTTYHYMYTILGTDMQESDYSKVVHATPFSAPNGDANGDLSVNVLDITSVVAYMLNQNPTPFLFDAADVNSDDEINVLDIIGIIQLISAEKSVPLSNLIYTALEPAYISIEEDGIYLESSGRVAALQFELNGEQLEQMKVKSKIKGFEFSYVYDKGKIIGILYSLSKMTIPQGKVEIFGFDKELSDWKWGETIGGDWDGNYIPILQQRIIGNGNDDLQVKILPNPFRNSTQIRFILSEQSMVEIKIYDQNGKLIDQLFNGDLSEGEHQFVWNGIAGTEKSLSNGVYYCHISANPLSNPEERVEHTSKLILMQ